MNSSIYPHVIMSLPLWACSCTACIVSIIRSLDKGPMTRGSTGRFMDKREIHDTRRTCVRISPAIASNREQLTLPIKTQSRTRVYVHLAHVLAMFSIRLEDKNTTTRQTFLRSNVLEYIRRMNRTWIPRLNDTHNHKIHFLFHFEIFIFIPRGFFHFLFHFLFPTIDGLLHLDVSTVV